MKYKIYSDPGHGWIAVKRKELEDLNIINNISHCSYQSRTGKTVYLEEDCDAKIFLDAKGVGIRDIPCVEKNYDKYCFVRYLPSFVK